MVGILVSLLCAVTWASGSILVRDLSRKLDPFTLNAPRSLVGAIVLLAFTLATGRTTGYQQVTNEKLFFMLASVCVGGGLGDTFYLSSLARIGASRAYPIASTFPLITFLLGLFFLQEELSLAVVAGLVAVIIGIILVGKPPKTTQTSPSSQLSMWGVPFALAAAICWGGSMVLLAPGIEGLDSIMVSSIRVPALSLILWGIVALRRTASKLLTLTRKEWAMLIVGGFLSWGLGSFLFVLAVALAGPTRAAIVVSTSPLFALPLTVIFLKEKLTPTILLGTALTVAGVVLVA